MSPESPRRDPIAALALLDEPKRRRLYEYVAAQRSEVGRDEAAAATGVSRALAAFHLDRLVEADLLEASYRRPPGRGGPGAGRPAKLYRRSDAEVSVSLPTRRYAAAAEVFAEALERLSADDETGPVAEAIADAAKDHGRALGREARHKAGKRPGRAALRKALVGVLETSGFEPEIAGTGSVTLCNCPYRMLSDRHRDVTCGMNLAWAEGVAEGLGSSALAPSAMPTPGRCCVTFASPTE